MSNTPLEYFDDGLSQAARSLPALSPEYVQIDDRDIFELYQYVYKISALFNYFNLSDKPDGDWQSFFNKNAYSVNGLISGADEKKIQDLYNRFKDNIAASLNFRELKNAVKELLHLLISIGDLLLDVSDQINYIKLNAENIHDEIADNYKRLYTRAMEIEYILNANLHLKFNTNYAAGVSHLYLNNTSLHDLKKIKNELNTEFLQLDDVFSLFAIHYSLIKAHVGVEKATSEHSPHIAMLIAFLRLFSHAQNQINGITRKHLGYYYDNILQLKPKTGTPDRAYLILELAGLIDEVKLDANTIFVGKPGGNPPGIEYKLLYDTIVNRAAVAELKTVYIEDIDRNNYNDDDETVIYTSANPLNDIKTVVKNPELIKDWALFGESQRKLSAAGQTMQYVDIGFVIGSPLLYLKEGERTVRLNIIFFPFEQIAGKTNNAGRLKIDETSFIVSMTGEKNWFDVDYEVKSDVKKEQRGRIEIVRIEIELEIKLNEDDNALAPYNPAVHGGSYSLDYPAVRFLLNNYGTYKVYPVFKDLLIHEINIRSSVKHYQNIRLQNSLGLVSPGTPFQIFGPIPNVGSYLDIKDTNVFNKYTTGFEVYLEWLDLPQQMGGFTDYYEEYDLDITNDSFKVVTGSVLNGKYTVNNKADLDEYYLFKTENGFLNNFTTIKVDNLTDMEFGNRMKLAAEAEDGDFIHGAIRIELVAPQVAFGHRVFPQIFSETAMENARGLKIFRKKRTLPNTPYIPMVKRVAINYTLEQMEVLATNKSTAELQITHIYPYGYHDIYPKSHMGFNIIPQLSPHTRHLANALSLNSILYIGLKDALPGQELSFFFKFSHNNIYKANYSTEPVHWYYLTGNEWKPLEQQNIILDTTYDLINTGIIKIRLPLDIQTGNTILNPGLHWLMAGVAVPDNKQFRILGIYTQVALVERVIDNSVADINEEYKMPPNSIIALGAKNPKIQTVWQPFTSFGGMRAPSRNDFFVSSSERLRHKQRPLLMVDILQAILEKFPDITVAKCVNRSFNYTIHPGINIYIVVMRRVNNYSTISKSQIEVDIPLLTTIKQYLQTIISPFAKIEVGNVVLEHVKVICSVVFNIGSSLVDNGFYTQKLSDDINAYIAPWLNNANAEVKIGAKINVLDFLNFIKNLYYVDYITGFSLLHFYSETDKNTGEPLQRVTDYHKYKDGFIHAHAPEAVFYPSEGHIINVMERSGHKEQERAGIKNLKVGGELVVTGDEWLYRHTIKSHPAAAEEEHGESDNLYEFTINI